MPARRRLNPVPDQPGRVALYVRVSAVMGREGEAFHSPDLQVESARRAAAAAGLREVCEPISDIDVSGRSFSRGGIDKLRALVEERKVDVVAVYDLSRLGRNLAESLTFITWLREHGVSVMSAQEKIDDSPEGQFMLAQFLSLAQLYSDQRSRGWRDVVIARARQGYGHGGGQRLGYRYQRDENGRPLKGVPIQVDPVEGPLITEAFRRYAAGDKIADIVRTIAQGRGKHTAIPTVKSVLANPFYLGKVVLWQRDHRTTRARGNLTVNDVPAFIGPGKHEPLIDQETFDKVQRRLRRDSKEYAGHLAISHSLVGLVFCAHCQRHAQKHTTGKGHVERYQCGSNTGGTRRLLEPCCGLGSPRVAEVEDEVLDQLRSKLSRLRGDDAERAADLARRVREKTDAELLATELAEVRRRLRDTVRRQVETTSETTMAALAELQAELEAQDASLTERLEAIQAPEDGHDMTFEQFANLGETVLALWPDATAAERNRMLKAVVRRVEIRKATRWREPAADRVRVEFR